MDRIIEKLDRGWWVVSHEQKLWLPGGELPHGEAVNFDLVGQHALHIGEWQGCDGAYVAPAGSHRRDGLPR